MNLKRLLIGFAVVCIIASVIMYQFKHDSHLSELGDVFWIPLPIGLISVVIALTSKFKK